jgi:hypothetical protein
MARAGNATKELGRNHPAVATSLNNLGLLYYLHERKTAEACVRKPATTGLSVNHASPPADQGTNGEAVGRP